jgi:hypothetical protein
VARDYVSAAVASCQEAIQGVILAITRDYLALKSIQRQKAATLDKLENDAEYIPKSAKVAFKLTAPPALMETQEFKELSTAMEEKTKAYTLDCKKAIAAVAKLGYEESKENVRELFKKGLQQICTFAYIEQNPSVRNIPTSKFAWYIADQLEVAVFTETFSSKGKLLGDLKRDFDDAEDQAADAVVVFNSAEKLCFNLLKCEVNKQLSIEQFCAAMRAQEVSKGLEKSAKEFLLGAATNATAMELDQEPSTTPSRIHKLINKAVQDKTARLSSEIQKLKETYKRSPSSTTTKNSVRGAPASSKSAPSTKQSNKTGQNKGKDNATKEKASPKPSPRKNAAKGNSGDDKGKGTGKNNNKKQSNVCSPSKQKKHNNTNNRRSLT